MKFITYLLFFTDIIYTIIIVIYLVLTGKISECLEFIIFLGCFEVIYIMLSCVVFCYQDIFLVLHMYDGFIMILIPIIFGLALYDFLDSEHFPIAFQVFFDFRY